MVQTLKLEVKEKVNVYISFIIFIYISIQGIVFSKDFEIEPSKSQIQYEFSIKPSPIVYADVLILKSVLSLGDDSWKGELVFDLSNSKSCELEDGKKEWSESRDERIVKISSAKDENPKFTLEKIEGIPKDFFKTNPSSQDLVLTIKGKLRLNKVEKEIELRGMMKFNSEGLHFHSEYKLRWSDFEIDNPVMWFMRVAKTPEDVIVLKFNIFAKGL